MVPLHWVDCISMLKEATKRKEYFAQCTMHMHKESFVLACTAQLTPDPSTICVQIKSNTGIHTDLDSFAEQVCL